MVMGHSSSFSGCDTDLSVCHNGFPFCPLTNQMLSTESTVLPWESVSHYWVYMQVCKDAEKDVEMQRNRTCIPGLKPRQVCTNMLHVVGMISL